jgi:hypothetical protein
MSSDDLPGQLGERIKTLAGNWASYTVLGTFVLYAFGYLSLRFQVSALGVVSSDFAVLDERYLFAGIDFLVYLVPQAPSAFLLIILFGAFPLVLLLGLAAAGLKLAGKDARSAARWLCDRSTSPGAAPTLGAIGIVVTVALIQIMRQSFAFQSLLLAREFPRAPAWLAHMLLSEDGASRVLYFIGILVATLACAAGLALLWNKLRMHWWGRWLAWMYLFFVLLQFLLWPANYALLAIAEKSPRVASLDGEKALSEGEEAWLVWKSKENLTFLVVKAGGDARSLMTVPTKDVKKLIITGHDRLLTKLHGKP